MTHAAIVDSVGDWAITAYRADESLTHLPTGTRLPAQGSRNAMHLALGELAELPRFDLQTWEANREAVRAVLDRHGLRDGEEG
jgi:hypothetical protein